jgi:hypothetical protein
MFLSDEATNSYDTHTNTHLLVYFLLQISSKALKDSKFGNAIVISTSEGSGGGGYTLGFRIDPKERLDSVFKELVDINNKVCMHESCTSCRHKQQGISA